MNWRTFLVNILRYEPEVLTIGDYSHFMWYDVGCEEFILRIGPDSVELQRFMFVKDESGVPKETHMFDTPDGGSVHGKTEIKSYDDPDDLTNIFLDIFKYFAEYENQEK